MAPAIPPLVVLSVLGIRNMVWILSQQTGWASKAGWSLTVIIMAFMFFHNGSYIYSQFKYIRPLEYLSEKVDRDSYISRYRREHAVIVHANQVLPQDASVLCISIGGRTYYLDRSVHLAEDIYDRKDGKYLEEELLKKLKRYGTTHIIMDRKVFFDWLRTLDENEQSDFLGVFKINTKLIYEKNDVLLLELFSNVHVE